MSFITDPPSTSFNTLLLGSKFVVADLQRDYDWKIKEREKFWKDSIGIIDDDIEQYFLGPMVFKIDGEHKNLLMMQRKFGN